MGVDRFEDFVEAHYDHVRRGLILALGNRERAEEVAQEAFARALGRWDAVSGMERPVAWVYVVAINQARRDLRRDSQRRELIAPAQGDHDLAGAVATSVMVTTALGTLPPRQRVMVVLRYFAGLSIAEVADATGCAAGTVKATLHAALSTLRVEIDREDL